MLFKSNQMPPVLTNNTTLMGQSIPPPTNNSMMGAVMPNHFPSASQDVDLRSVVDPRLNRNMDLDMRSMPGNAVNNTNPMMDPSFMRQPVNQPRPMAVAAPFQTDPRQRSDPRVKQQPPPQQSQPPIPPSQQSASLPNRIPTGIPNDASDQEKAQLIMQVLQLSDEQIAMLPPEQRASILVLKEQIAKSTQR